MHYALWRRWRCAAQHHVERHVGVHPRRSQRGTVRQLGPAEDQPLLLRWHAGVEPHGMLDVHDGGLVATRRRLHDDVEHAVLLVHAIHLEADHGPCVDIDGDDRRDIRAHHEPELDPIAPSDATVEALHVDSHSCPRMNIVLNAHHLPLRAKDAEGAAIAVRGRQGEGRPRQRMLDQNLVLYAMRAEAAGSVPVPDGVLCEALAAVKDDELWVLNRTAVLPGDSDDARERPAVVGALGREAPGHDVAAVGLGRHARGRVVVLVVGLAQRRPDHKHAPLARSVWLSVDVRL
mmetsp:Transcript_36000/g.119223  ORF Transcript_36000/g.119223 Transcript_36000/m.119223 type:complete len:290 (+) Transcript_36000:309-1178(+)